MMFKVVHKAFVSLLILLTVGVCYAFAEGVIMVSYVSDDGDFEVVSGQTQGGQFGTNIYSADVDEDGVEEVLIGSPYASINGLTWNGLIKVMGDDGFEILIEGMNDKDYYGVSYCLGDFNNDGRQDLAAGAYKNSRVDLYYSVDSYAGEMPDVSIEGAEGEDFGTYLVCDDYNGDDIDDLLVGAPYGKDSINRVSGDVYLYYGGVDKKFDVYDGVYYGQVVDELFGSSFDVGDLNGDGDMEIVIGAPGSSTAYMIDGKSWIELKDAEGVEMFGFDVEMGDLNGDSFDDVVVSAFPYGGEGNGSVTIYFGGEVLDGERDLYIGGVRGGGLLGSDLEVFDYTGDQVNDLVVGAPQVNGSGNGGIYVVDGSDLKAGLSSAVYGIEGGDWFGYSVDNWREKIVVGARYADGENSSSDGKIYLVERGAKLEYIEKNRDSMIDYITRSKAVSLIVEEFKIREKEGDLIKSCYEYRDFCFYNFMTMSSFEGIELEPEIVLYPDIATSHEYYEEVTIATMVGLVNGYLSEANSPFRPDYPISRIQALKVVLGAGEIVPPKYKFELVDILGSLEELLNQKSYFKDVDPRIDHMWWYPRYVNFAVENEIVGSGEYFRPDEPITEDELRRLIEKTLDYLNSTDAEVEL